MNNGTGENEANAVYRLLQEWNLFKKMQGMSFDTTSVNTGRHTGVCKRLENKLRRELLWLACRHHILELILAKVVSLCFGLSNSPKIPLFQRFISNWSKVDRQYLSHLLVKPQADDFTHCIIGFLRENDILQKQVSDDYKELMNSQ